ncbi:hypothetical protein [Singulisphaera acidiphila]|uniref:Uncharacterized protein n=1 Tax=Singulisphaera acidiphila (strain ATCC BAA-1392 / DSM 18658 / VKM B-2454 / MOB10) TaxID=886293 RepID=L0DC94_SINAD|nr:hypothetical protein [Singulisphaera acidiphila]AGA26480.1 hypothetical protein Sinac_2147 [Singulisphaera acidiphila DSM 18658]
MLTTLTFKSSAVNRPHSDRNAAVHEAAIAEIVGMIRAKYSEDGDRSFAIGKRAFEHAQWQKGNFPDYDPAHFDTLMRRIRDDVRLYVSIKAESIRVADWVRCHVLRELCRTVIADRADKLSMFEYRAIAGKALTFSTKDVEGCLNPGWLDMIRGIAADRATGGRVTREDFQSRVAATVKSIAESMAADSQAAAKAASDAIRAKKRAAAKARTALASLLSDGISGEHISADDVMSILESVAKQHGKPLPSGIGFDPAACDESDCDLLASTMFHAGKYAEMVRLRDRLDRMVSSVDEARASRHR